MVYKNKAVRIVNNESQRIKDAKVITVDEADVIYTPTIVLIGASDLYTFELEGGINLTQALASFMFNVYITLLQETKNRTK